MEAMLKDNTNIVNLKSNNNIRVNFKKEKDLNLEGNFIIKAITNTLGNISSIGAKLALGEEETLDSMF
jgi:hypothetical protein